MAGRLKNPEIDTLFEAILKLESIDECYKFFQDICTVAEIQAIAQRLSVAIMLHKGATYNAINEKTGASAATISRVHKSLNYGEDGYKNIIKKLDISKN